jgi:PPP family 3-phenylpropionic acid transporter
MNAVSKKIALTLRLQYFLYFGVMGVFLPFFNLYCYHLGFTGFQIGVLSGARTFAMVIFSLFWGYVADRYAIRKPVYIFCNFLACLVWALYLFTEKFGPMLVITILYSIFYGPIIAFLEAFTMDTLGQAGGDKRRYGNIRVWGSMNFILVVSILGRVIDAVPIKTILVLILAGSFLQCAFSVSVPRTVRPPVISTFFSKMKYFANKRTLVFLLCAFLMLASHGTYYGFFSIQLEKLGYGRTFIGFSWAVASLAEIFVMLRSDILFKRFSIRAVLIFAFAVAAIRWAVLCFSVSPWMIIFAQILHAVTYGAFHIGCILYMDELSHEEVKTLGQVANNAVSYGLGMMTGFVLNGMFYETAGAHLYLASSFTAIAGGLLFAFSGRTNRLTS